MTIQVELSLENKSTLYSPLSLALFKGNTPEKFT